VNLAQLSVIISEAIRDRFRPKLPPEQRKQALLDVDARLAQWTLSLPENLALRPTLTLDLNATMLHLLYNTALILLHRPRPTNNGDHETKPEDADICSAAAAHVQSLMEGLRERGMLLYLPNSSVHFCFTAMIQLSVELRLANPVLATAAQRRFDSLMTSLRGLADAWPQAEPILYFFEHISRRREAPHAHGPAQIGSEVPMLDPQLESTTATTQGNEASIYANEELPVQQTYKWQQLFPNAIDLHNYHAGVQDWDEWQTLYWQNAGAESSEYGLPT
jgi:transcriptional regulatory protein AMDR